MKKTLLLFGLMALTFSPWLHILHHYTDGKSHPKVLGTHFFAVRDSAGEYDKTSYSVVVYEVGRDRDTSEVLLEFQLPAGTTVKGIQVDRDTFQCIAVDVIAPNLGFGDENFMFPSSDDTPMWWEKKFRKIVGFRHRTR